MRPAALIPNVSCHATAVADSASWRVCKPLVTCPSCRKVPIFSLSARPGAGAVSLSWEPFVVAVVVRAQRLNREWGDRPDSGGQPLEVEVGFVAQHGEDDVTQLACQGDLGGVCSVASQVAILAYEAMRDNLRVGEKLTGIPVSGVSPRNYKRVVPEMAEACVAFAYGCSVVWATAADVASRQRYSACCVG